MKIGFIGFIAGYTVQVTGTISQAVKGPHKYLCDPCVVGAFVVLRQLFSILDSVYHTQHIGTLCSLCLGDGTVEEISNSLLNWDPFEPQRSIVVAAEDKSQHFM